MYPESRSVTFGEAIRLFFVRYTDFSTRSRRSEYWYATLFNYVLGYAVGLLVPSLGWILVLATMIPSIAICVRRLHDVGKSGWFYLLNLIPFVGSIILLVWFCQDSGPDNRWGPNPKAPRRRYHDDFRSDYRNGFDDDDLFF